MWPMSHALYPGLNNNNPRERPTTAESRKTWYGNNGNNSKFFESTSSIHSERSLHSLAPPEPEAPAEDLGDLIHRTRRVLSVLSVDDDSELQAKQVQQPTEHEDGAGQSINNTSNKDASTLEESPQDSGEAGFRPKTKSLQSTAATSRPGSPDLTPGDTAATSRPGSSHPIQRGTAVTSRPGSSDLTPGDTAVASHPSSSDLTPKDNLVTSRPESSDPISEHICSRPSTKSTFMSFVSYPDDAEGSSTVLQSHRSLCGAESTSGPVRGAEVWKPKPTSLRTESRSQHETGPAIHPSPGDVARNIGSSSATISTPAEGTTAAPSFILGWEPSEKRPESVEINLKVSSSDSLGHQDTQKEKNEEQEQEQVEEEVDPTTNHISGMPLVSLTIALSAAVFLVAMDVNVIATAVPRITGEFRSLDDVGWYGSSFLMATCATQIPYGRIYSLFPAKWVFISAILVFMLGSLIAGVSPNSPVLIFGRAVQGVGTSGILSGGLIIMSQVVPLRIRPLLTSVIGAMEGVAMISAPIIGGVLTDNLNWRWCFYINLPIGGFVLLVVMFCMHSPKHMGRRRPAGTTLWQTLYELDLLGAAALLPPIVCTLLALHFAGGEGHSWGDNDVILLLVLGFVLFCVFAYTQRLNAAVAMLPFRVVKHRSVLAGFWFITCTSSALVVITYFLPLWYQTIKDTSAQQSGIGILPMLVAVIVGVLGSGFLVTFVGYYTPFMLASSVLMPVGLGLLTTIGPDTSRAALFIYPAIFGLGVGMGFQQPLIGVQATLPQADIAPGTTVIVFGQTIGAAIMIAVGESVFQTRLVANLADYLGLTDINTQQLLGTGPTSLQSMVPTEKLPVLILAVNASLTQTFYVAVAMASLSCIGSVFIGWKSVKEPKNKEEEAVETTEPAQV